MTRRITTHAHNALNDALIIEATDEPGIGGAHHEYLITTEIPTIDQPNQLVDRGGWRISFQNGGVAVSGVNGISHEALLAIIRDRLMCFQRGPFVCEESENALYHVDMALKILHARTAERTRRGVEGKHEV